MVAKKQVELKLGPEDLAKVRRKWTQADASVDSVECINLLQYVPASERFHFVNELHRVMKKGSKCQLVVPHWASNRAFSDLRFEYPPVVEGWLYHLNAEWRKTGNPKEKAYKCDFDVTFGWGMHQAICARNAEYQQNALMWWKEAAQDLIATLTKRG